MINKKIIKLIPKNKKYDMPDLIRKAIMKRKKVVAFYIYEDWYDFGTKENLKKIRKKVI